MVGEAAQDESLGLAFERSRRALERDRLDPEAEPDRAVAPEQAEQTVPQPRVRSQVEWRANAQEVVLDLLRHLEQEWPELRPAEQHGHARPQQGLLPLPLDSVQRQRRPNAADGVGGGAARREDEVHPRGQAPLAPDALRGARRLGSICSLPAAPRRLARCRLLRGDLRLVRLLRAPREVRTRLEGCAPPRRLHRSPGSLREDGGDGVDVFERRAKST